MSVPLQAGCQHNLCMFDLDVFCVQRYKHRSYMQMVNLYHLCSLVFLFHRAFDVETCSGYDFQPQKSEVSWPVILPFARTFQPKADQDAVSTVAGSEVESGYGRIFLYLLWYMLKRNVSNEFAFAFRNHRFSEAPMQRGESPGGFSVISEPGSSKKAHFVAPSYYMKMERFLCLRILSWLTLKDVQ